MSTFLPAVNSESVTFCILGDGGEERGKNRERERERGEKKKEKKNKRREKKKKKREKKSVIERQIMERAVRMRGQSGNEMLAGTVPGLEKCVVDCMTETK